MKRSIWVYSVVGLLGAAGLIGQSSLGATKTAPVTTTPTSGHIPPIRCATSAQVLAALAIARTTPNIVIELQPIEYTFNSSLVVQGDGTTIHGNGATIVTYASFTGLKEPLTNCPGTGAGILVEPMMGPTVKNTKQKNGLWFNPRGTVEALNVAAGGSWQYFNEQAPCQDGVLPALSTYTLFAPYIVPARNITIQDLSVRFASSYSDAVLYVVYSQNVTFSNVAGLNRPADLGTGGGPGDMWAVGSQGVNFDSCQGPMYIEMNSCTNCTVSNSTVGGVTFEEMCRSCTVSNNDLQACRTNDIVCSDIAFISNSFSYPGSNTGALWGGTRLTFKNNVCEGGVWLGGETRSCVVSGNRGTAFDNDAARSSGNSMTANTLGE